MGKPYTRQFKQQVIQMVMEQGRRPSQVARELGMPHSTMMLWLHKAGYREPDPEGALSQDPAVLQAQVRELRRQNKRLEMEKEILKKATAYFAGQSQRGLPSSESGEGSTP